MRTVLFACVHNAGRSQMAAAWFNALSDKSKARAVSAGTEPGPRVHPEVVQIMREARIELEGIAPQKLTEDLAAGCAILITMGCGEACPHVAGVRRMDWPLEDPKAKPVERVREIRDDVRSRVEALLEAEGWRAPTMALSFELRAARGEDREPVSQLLSDASLPLDGLDDGFPNAYVVAWSGLAVVGAAGLEQYDAAGLLRSVVVRADARGLGIGRALVTDRLAHARSVGLERVFLLTTTATSFFQGLGFARASRREAPAGMLASPEFAGICPESAACLARQP